MIDMLKRHEIQVLRRAGHSQIEVATLAGVGRRTVQRVDGEAAVTHIDSVRQHEVRGIDPPAKAEPFRSVIAEILAGDPQLLSVEVLRRVSLKGYEGGKTAVYDLVRELRPKTSRPLVRFEGLAGELTQHDFGHVDVRFLNGTEKRVHFFASRLKYSRWVEVTIVPDERTETLVRTFVDHFAAIGGAPLLAVFDRPKTVALKWTRDGQVTDWNPLFAGVALDLSVGIEVCWPAAPWQKGSVENLVGWVKGSFFKQRRFVDDADLLQQLAEWRTDVNTQRPCRATKIIPAVRLEEERPRLRSLKVAPADLALRVPVVVGPTAEVIHDTHPYSMSADAIGIAGTLYLYRDRVRIVAGRFAVTHERKFQPGEGSILPEHRAQHVAAVSGKRAKRYLQREHLLKLGPEALAYLTELTHRRPQVWLRDIDRLHTLLATYGDDVMRGALARGVAERHRCGVHRALPRGGRDHAEANRGGESRSARHSIVVRRAFWAVELRERDAPLRHSVGNCRPCTARRPGPARRRRPPGRSEAEGLDAGEHGATL
jgi:transposase